MSIKLTRKQLKQIILEELEEIKTDGRGFGPAQVATAKALSAKGVAKRPESVRTRLMQLVADLDLQNPTQEEIRQLADMVSDLMDAAQDADQIGLDEDIIAIIDEEVKNYLEEALHYGLIEENDNLNEKKKKKACKPSKGKKFARRVKGKCVSYGQAGKAKGGGARIKPGTGKGNAYCARSYGDMKSHGKDCSGKDRGTPLCLSRQKWKCSGKYSRKGK